MSISATRQNTDNRTLRKKHSYDIIPGFFSETSADPHGTQSQVLPSFGLNDLSSERWKNLKTSLSRLNSAAPKGTTYRVLYVGRHGQGFHNVAESLYGSPEWNKTQAKLYGDENMTWGPDPKLTELGIQQAQNVHNAWKTEMEHGIPLPESLYSSPFTRAAHTALITFDKILINSSSSPDGQKRPVIKEKLREVNGVHTCDKRSSRSYIAKTFPQFDIEAGFSEEDELWTPDHRETEEELTARLEEALDEIFSEDSTTYISITAHGGAIRALLRVLGHHPRELPVGGVIAFVVKVTTHE